MGIRLATEGDIPELAGVLARAFADDPFYTYLAGTAPERNQRMRDGWSGLLRHASNRLSLTYTTDDLAGAAIWHPPGYRSEERRAGREWRSRRGPRVRR